MTFKIKTGDKISITELKSEKVRWRDRNKLKDLDLEDGKLELISQVEDVLSDTDIVALTPISNRQLVRLPESSKYKVTFFTTSGMVSYAMKIDSYFQEGDVFLMRFKLTSSPQPIHNRKFFRLECSMPMKFSLMSGDNVSEEDEDTLAADDFAYDGMIRDISGGGMCFWANERIAPNKKIRCKMMLDTELLIVIGTVLRRPTQSKISSTDYQYEYFVNFTGITNLDQEKLVKFIFAEQRAQLKIIR